MGLQAFSLTLQNSALVPAGDVPKSELSTSVHNCSNLHSSLTGHDALGGNLAGWWLCLSVTTYMLCPQWVILLLVATHQYISDMSVATYRWYTLVHLWHNYVSNNLGDALKGDLTVSGYTSVQLLHVSNNLQVIPSEVILLLVFTYQYKSVTIYRWYPHCLTGDLTVAGSYTPVQVSSNLRVMPSEVISHILQQADSMRMLSWSTTSTFHSPAFFMGRITSFMISTDTKDCQLSTVKWANLQFQLFCSIHLFNHIFCLNSLHLQ